MAGLPRRRIGGVQVSQTLVTVTAPSATVPPGYPGLHAFARQIKPDGVLAKVKMAGKLKPLGNCYWNVARVVEESGGQIQFGWLFFAAPSLYLEAMHHSVWRMPSGRLIDVTAKYDLDPVRAYSTFMCDDSLTIDLERVPAITSRHAALSEAPEVGAFIEAYLAKNAVERELSEVQWKAGYRCQEQFALRTGPEAQGAQVNVAYIGQLEELAARLRATKIELGKRIADLRRIKPV